MKSDNIGLYTAKLLIKLAFVDQIYIYIYIYIYITLCINKQTIIQYKQYPLKQAAKSEYYYNHSHQFTVNTNTTRNAAVKVSFKQQNKYINKYINECDNVHINVSKQRFLNRTLWNPVSCTHKPKSRHVAKRRAGVGRPNCPQTAFLPNKFI